jgi:hypothetical protein
VLVASRGRQPTHGLGEPPTSASARFSTTVPISRVFVMMCETCGADPCRNPHLCAQCRKADEKTATKSQPKLVQILDDVHDFLGRFVIYPSKEAQDAHVLWIAHAHVMDAWESTPRIMFASAEPASGKTRALELTELLVPNPVEAVNVSPAYLFRKVGSKSGAPTVLFDEIDTIFGPKAKENEEIRGLLNAGHRRGAVAGRCVVHGKTVLTEEIPAYCAVALAGLGWLPDTIFSRSVIIRMRRRAPHEKITPFRRRVYVKEGNRLRDQLATWAAGAVKAMTEARPVMPDGIEDRNADVWEAPLAIAEAAGGHWIKRAQVAAVALVAAASDKEPSLGIRLLSDLHDIFDEDQMTTAEILQRLHGLPEAPWNDLRGKPLNARGLAFRLREYGVKSKSLSIGGEYGPRPKGYARCDLQNVWEIYLPPPPSSPDKSATAATGATEPDFQGSDVAVVADEGSAVADAVADEGRAESADKTDTVAAVADVADVAGNGGQPPPEVCAQCAAAEPGPLFLALATEGERCASTGNASGSG